MPPPVTSGLIGHLDADALTNALGSRVTSAPAVGSGATHNQALGKAVTLNDATTTTGAGGSLASHVTNGVTSDPAQHLDGGTGNQFVQIDMGTVRTIDSVRVWHYYADGRTYNGPKTEVSQDGTTWTTVATPALYAESSSGHLRTFAPISARYIRDWINGSSSNASNHWVEVAAFGPTPAWTAQNNGPILRAGGYNQKKYLEQTSAGDAMRLATDLRYGDHTIIVAAKQRGFQNQRILSSVRNNYLLGWWSGRSGVCHADGGWIYLDGAETQSPAQTELLFFTSRRVGASLQFFKGMTQLASGDRPGPWELTTAGYQGSSEFSDANVYEVLIYDRALSDSERQQIHDYLTGKYKPSVGCVNGYSRRVRDLVPASYWRLQDGNTAAGAVAARAHGGGTATYRGTITRTSGYTGADGVSVVFDGADDQITTDTTLADLIMHGTHSVAWVFRVATNGLTGENMVFGGGTAAVNQGLHLGVRDGRLYQGFYSNDLGGPAIEADRWYHVVMVFDGSFQRIYLDGVHVASRSTTTGYTGSSGDLGMGRHFGGAANNPRFRLNEFALYDRALSTAEIEDLYNGWLPPENFWYKREIKNDAPIVYLPMDDDVNATVCADASGNGKNGTPGGSTTAGHPRVMEEGGVSRHVSGGNVALPTGLYSNPAAITFEIWAKKNEGPTSNALFHVNNAAGARIANVHLVWGDGTIYWDCGDGWQRIQKQVDFDYQQPHHYVFTRVASTGDMKIYVDGVLWHSGTVGAGVAIGVANQMHVGSYNDGGAPVNALVDEFAVYTKELTAAQVRKHYQLGAARVDGDRAVVTCRFVPGRRSLVVPASGVGFVEAEVVGGAGDGGLPGQGGRSIGRLPVSAGQQLNVDTGGRGVGRIGGWGGSGVGWGGSGGTDTEGGKVGYGGGGRSALSDASLFHIVAGGGGGGNGVWQSTHKQAGHGGGLVGQEAPGGTINQEVSRKATGGNTTGGSTGIGAMPMWTDSTAAQGKNGGMNGEGGDGGSVAWYSNAPGGGGGGGWYGGGGGCDMYGPSTGGGYYYDGTPGAGGSSYHSGSVTLLRHDQGGNGGHGFVKVWYATVPKSSSYSAGVALNARGILTSSPLAEMLAYGNLAARAALSVAPVRTTQVAAALNARGVLSVNAIRELVASVNLYAAGAMSANSDPQGAALLIAPGHLQAVPRLTVFSAVELLAPGRLVVGGIRVTFTTADLRAAANLRVGETARTTFGAVKLLAPALLNADSVPLKPASANLLAPAKLTSFATRLAIFVRSPSTGKLVPCIVRVRQNWQDPFMVPAVRVRADGTLPFKTIQEGLT